jgi:hypothetical protein
VSFKFEGVDKHSMYLSVCFICCFACFCLYIIFFSFCYYVVIWATYIVTVDCMSLVCLTCLNNAYH